MEKHSIIIPGVLEPILTDIPPEDFLQGLPQMQGYASPRMTSYIRDREAKRRKRYTQDVNQVWVEFDEYTNRLQKLVATFGPLFSSYDKEIILPATCALGMHKAAHSDMDEKGGLGRDRHFSYSPAIMRELVDYYAQSVRDAIKNKDYSLSAPRGKNCGYPTPKASRSRECADVLLFLHSAIAMGSKKMGMSLDDLDLFLSQFFGPVLAIAGERQQTKDAWFFEQYHASILFAINFFYRVRGIYFSPKYKVLSNRLAIKPLLKGILSVPMHDQDRVSISKRIRAWRQSGWVCWSKDVSKFDQSHGGAIGLSLCRIAADILLAAGWSTDMYRDFANEFSTPMLLSDRNGLYVSKGGEILSSGVSMTSIVNCIASHAVVLQVMARLLGTDVHTAQSQYQKSWDAITFGDDIVCAINPKHVSKEFANDIENSFDSICLNELDLTVTSEPTLKFLGQNYDMLSFKDASCGYPLGRFFQQQFFPERVKRWPFSTIGYIARLDLLDEGISKEVHKRMAPFFEELDLGPFFNWQDRHQVLIKLLPEVEKRSAEIAQMDDILGVLGHGLDPEDNIDLFSALDDSFIDLLALAYIDVSNPAESLRTGEYSNISKQFIANLHDIQRGNLSLIPIVTSQLVSAFGGEWRGVGEMYF